MAVDGRSCQQSEGRCKVKDRHQIMAILNETNANDWTHEEVIELKNEVARLEEFVEMAGQLDEDLGAKTAMQDLDAALGYRSITKVIVLGSAGSEDERMIDGHLVRATARFAMALVDEIREKAVAACLVHTSPSLEAIGYIITTIHERDRAIAAGALLSPVSRDTASGRIIITPAQ